MPLQTGVNGAFQWLATEQDLDDLLRLSPEAVLGKYLAVTSIDSGFLFIDEQLKSDGWYSRNKIAYSSRIQSVEALPHEGYDEWYVLEAATDLGQLVEGNPFEAPPKPGQVYACVNYGGCHLHDHSMLAVADLFWKQLEWINPESYFADGGHCLTFVTRNKGLFTAVSRALGNVA